MIHITSQNSNEIQNTPNTKGDAKNIDVGSATNESPKAQSPNNDREHERPIYE